ncbi:MAG: hypothetical protein J2P36_23160 [Ktedonobacteraceae bacterium]|nr:hypothetical protein [Ktedonobacteraceae bacterium]
MKKKATVTNITEVAPTDLGGSAIICGTSKGGRYAVFLDADYNPVDCWNMDTCERCKACQHGLNCYHKQAAVDFYATQRVQLLDDKKNPIVQVWRNGKFFCRVSQLNSSERRARYVSLFDPNYENAVA